jgi:hypothetical protein
VFVTATAKERRERRLRGTLVLAFWGYDLAVKRQLRFRETISRQAAVEMLHAFVACGDHTHDTFFWSPQQVRDYYGSRYDEVIESVQRGEAIPVFENLLSATVHTVSPGGAIGVRVGATGEEFSVQEAGVFTLRDYVAKFEFAVEARDRAVARQAMTEVETATYHGVASIESFLNYYAAAWDRCFPNQPLPKVQNVYDKVEKWVPILAKGSVLDYKQISWEAFKKVKRFRNNATHSYQGAKGATLREIASMVNLFREGIAAPLFQLHQIFHEKIAGAIIRAAYAPEAFVTEEDSVASPA